MANMIMASSKTLISSSLIKPKLSFSLLPKKTQIPKIISLPSLSANSAAVKSISLFLAASLTAPLPSLAAEIEKAALFDFDLTLPIMAAEFLFLMVALDKVYYSPLGNFMDERDAKIKGMLGSVKDTSAEVKQLEEQGNAVMRAARAEIAAALNKMLKETEKEVEEKLEEGRKKLELELQEALANLEKQKEETIKALDSQIAALSDEIVKKVLPI